MAIVMDTDAFKAVGKGNESTLGRNDNVFKNELRLVNIKTKIVNVQQENDLYIINAF